MCFNFLSLIFFLILRILENIYFCICIQFFKFNSHLLKNSKYFYFLPCIFSFFIALSVFLVIGTELFFPLEKQRLEAKIHSFFS